MQPYSETQPNGYCRLFPPSKVCDSQRREALTDLGGAMLDSAQEIEGGADGGGPYVGYTYFGQFIDHDLTEMDPLPPPLWRRILRTLFRHYRFTVNVKSELRNLQTPRLDLSHLYGGGPSDQNSNRLYQSDGIRLNVGKLGASGRSFDIYVDADDNPVVADDRSRENLIIRQMVAVFARLHNAAVEQWALTIKEAEELFEQARRQTIWQFQYLVVQDYLRTVLDYSVFSEVFEKGNVVFEWKTTFSIPVEFAVAAFRFGHSMVRLNYQFSKDRDLKLKQIFERSALKGQLEEEWEIAWGFFFQGAGGEGSAITSQPIDTLVAKPLHDLLNFIVQLFPVAKLPLPVVTIDQFKLPVRTLLRGESMKLATGQTAADGFGVVRVTDDILTSPRPGTPPMTPHAPILQRGQILIKTPLWYYILKESESSSDGRRLGPVGSHIVAETISAALRYDQTSYFYNPEPLGSRDWRARNRLLLSSPPVWRIGGRTLQIFSLAELFSLATQLPFG
jgi:heme peroxidase